jgi:actin-like protein 6A
VRSPLAGRLLTRCTQHAVESKGVKIYPGYAFKRIETTAGKFKVDYNEPKSTTDSYRQFQVDSICEDIKHSICRVSEAPFNPEDNASIPTVSYELPDGQEIQVDAARLTVPELLFNPSLLSSFGDVGQGVLTSGAAVQSLPAAITDCINRCDVDIRREMYNGIVLTGGTTLFGTLRDRLERELTETAPAMVKVKVIAAANNVERRYSPWIGGSILASLGTFQQMWMSAEEYKEFGAGLVHKKSP